MLTTKNFTATASKEFLAARTEVENLNGWLSMYVGRVNGVQLLTNERWIV